MGIGTFVNQPAKGAASAIRRAKPANVDLPLLVIAITLAIFGLLMLYSASTSQYSATATFTTEFKNSPTYLILKQTLIMILGASLAFFIARMDYHLWQKYALWLMVVAIVGLIAVLIKGAVILESMRGLFGGSVSPAELAKLATVVYLSVWLYHKREYLHDIQLGLIPLAVILGIMGGLIFRQPDISAAGTVFLLGGLLFFLAGGDIRQIVIFMIVALLVGFVVVKFTATGQSRMGPYLAGLKDPLQSDYQVLRALEGIIRGGLFGVGIGHSSIAVTGIPFATSDSIFAVIVEELGLFGALITVGLYALILWRGMKIAAKAPDSLGSLLAAGLTLWIVIEAFIHMGGMAGLLPAAGNVLPFISQGGSNLVTVIIAIAILLSISRQTNKVGPVAEEWRSYGASADLRRRDRRRRVSRSRRA
ncbi:MAG: FtsW/RodA/SpoVE family cell cycle protein [Anaerolineales bacterium]|nr:FtsW/RodA/SpoVE family cell cycle protein [Anaerolineales bacterium]